MKVLLIESNPMLAEKLAEFLTVHRCVVDVAACEVIALGMQEQRDYHVILLNFALQNQGEGSLCRRLRQQGCTTPIVMLAAQTNASAMIQCLEAGADDCINPPFDSRLFLARLRAWRRRHSQTFTDSVLSWGALKLDPIQIRVTYHDRNIRLGPKEFGLLELFLRNPRRIFTRDAILDQLWTLDRFPTLATVTNLMKDLRCKLRAAGMHQPLIQTIYGMGYQLVAPPTPSENPLPTAENDAGKSLPGSDWDHVTDTFQKTLQEKLVTIAAVIEALKQDALTPEIQQQAKIAAHQLAIGLNALGYGQGAYILRAIEQWLAEPGPLSPARTDEFNHLLRRLRYVLTQPPSFEPFTSIIPEVNLEDSYERLTFTPYVCPVDLHPKFEHR